LQFSLLAPSWKIFISLKLLNGNSSEVRFFEKAFFSS